MATTAFTYDPRGRLIEEHRAGTYAPYWLKYQYDQGGNRLEKLQLDPASDPEEPDFIARTTYTYDTAEGLVDCNRDGVVDESDDSAAECFRSRHNRLMYYVVEAWEDDLGGDCDPPPLSNCCEAHEGHGCEDETCEQAVCAIEGYAYCCNPTFGWDASCADVAAAVCGELCDGPPPDWGCGPGWRPVERVWYQYVTGPTDMEAVGNPQFMTRQVFDPAGPCEPVEYYGYAFYYNKMGTLWFVTQWHATQEDHCEYGPWTCMPFEEVPIVRTDEFRNVGRSMRLSRQREHWYWSGIVEGTNVWHDYDGDEIYSDASVEIDNGALVLTPQAAHEAGIGTAWSTAAPGCENGCPPQYLHGDQIGSTREITGAATTGVPPAAEVVGSVVYTAFGEKVFSDGAIGRYQYAGAWGYQSDLYEDASGNLPFIHVGHRWYDPSTGRFLQRDPIGIASALNVYHYVSNEPVRSVDPNGLDRWIVGGSGEYDHQYIVIQDGDQYFCAHFYAPIWIDRNPGFFTDLWSGLRAIAGTTGAISTGACERPTRNILRHIQSTPEQDRAAIDWIKSKQLDPPRYSAQYHCQDFACSASNAGMGGCCDPSGPNGW